MTKNTVENATKNINFEPYFLKSGAWASFWQDSQNDLVSHFEFNGEKIYEFKYKMNARFWYIPHFGENRNVDKNLLKIFKTEAKKEKIDFITTEFSDTAKIQEESILKLPPAIRKTQYNATILVDTEGLKDEENIEYFVKNNPQMIANFASSFRRKVKKSLKENWKISTEKTQNNLENFWQVYNETATRQKFNVHPKNYYEKLFNLKNSRIIILFNEKMEVCGGWLGWQSEKNLTYLYGGNNDEALQRLGQYIIQLTALKMCAEENLDFYDLGGYEKGTGYGRFKEGFHGILREFHGPFDIVINPLKYNLLKTMGKIKNILK